MFIFFLILHLLEITLSSLYFKNNIFTSMIDGHKKQTKD